MFVLGTAGHIDHGKSVLINALTGINPDRLREEQERGMTIDLGFAWLKLPSGQEVGIVDVPGHEKFIKNMLAGVGGIDLALLIVAANESVMPQTREHLAIIDLLEIRKGIVAITKKDLVDDEMIELVRMDVEELIEPTSLAGSPIIPVSGITGEGLDELIQTIDTQLQSTEPRKDTGRPRMPIDRVFTISGSGTVITGTLIDSSLSIGQEVEIVPGGEKSRIRGLQSHKTRVDRAELGNRVAVNLVGLATTDINRGQVLTTPGWLKATTMLNARLRVLSHLRRGVPHNANVSFHSGAAETLAKVRLLDRDRLEPGDSALVQIALEEPVALVKGDHFIIRSTMETLGGGRIVDSHTNRLRRNRDDIIQGLEVKEAGTIDEVLEDLLESKQPLELAGLLSHSDLPASEARPAIDTMLEEGRIIGIGQGDQRLLYTAAGWNRLNLKVTDSLKEYHKKFPVRPGMPKAELGSRLDLGKYAPTIWQKLSAEGVVAETGSNVRLPSHEATLNKDQQAKVDTFLDSLKKNPYSPPTDLTPEPDLLNLLIDRGQVVKVHASVVYSSEAYNEMVDKVKAHIQANGSVSVAEVRDMFNTSRKYVLALLEYLDEKKVTRRTGDERVLY
ncbi:MAG: selenocysteine-specific translation elongation factor [Dehalococcoidales bacterium]|nr:selenocysteine-specific translation elongation factor [Dehalococcoidales bacterium]